MQLLILTALVAAAAAAPSGLIAYTVPVAPWALSSQYHAQDTLGQYNYGYISPLSSKAEARSINGITSGAYSYVDAEGKVQNVQYTSDALNGFRVAASNLPVAPPIPKVEPLPEPTPVEDTPEVAAAKAKHLEALKEAEVKAAEPAVVTAPVVAPTSIVAPGISTYAYGINAPLISAYGYPGITAYGAPLIAPSFLVNSPVAPVDTPEVVKARAEHLAAVEEVKARN